LRDRNMIMLALLFLAFTIGSGVNIALVECNKMIGQPIAPEPSHIYQEKKPVMVDGVKRVIVEDLNQAREKLGSEIDTKKVLIRRQVTELVNKIRDIN